MGGSVIQKMPVYFHALYTDGIDPEARFPRDRYRRLRARLEGGGSGDLISIQEAPLGSREQAELAHDSGYVGRFLNQELSEREVRRIGLRPWTPLLIPRTLRIVGGALAALDSALESGGLAGNMAGGTHHAHHDFGSGYCVFNDLAVCAEQALARPEISRVLVMDLDVHQGDGTATIFSENPAVVTVSVHCAANFPFRKATSDHDFPVPEGTGDEDFLAVVDEALQVGLRYRPDLLLFQAGVDGLEADALGRLSLTRRGMQQRNQKVFDACLAARIPCVVFMGGGYAKPIDATVDAFEDLFVQAAKAHRRQIL